MELSLSITIILQGHNEKQPTHTSTDRHFEVFWRVFIAPPNSFLWLHKTGKTVIPPATEGILGQFYHTVSPKYGAQIH